MNNIDRTLSKILGKSKGASVKRQTQWKGFSPLQKKVNRRMFKDRGLKQFIRKIFS